MTENVAVDPNVLSVEVRVIQREVKNGKEKGKKFFAYQIYNKKRGYFEELRFNSKVKNQPEGEGSFILEVDKKEINRQGIGNRKYPLTWISKVNSVSTLTESSHIIEGDEDLPF